MSLKEQEKHNYKLEEIKKIAKQFSLKDSWFKTIHPVLNHAMMVIVIIMLVLNLAMKPMDQTYGIMEIVGVGALFVTLILTIVINKKYSLISQILSSLLSILVFTIGVLTTVKNEFNIMSVLTLVVVFLALIIHLVEVCYRLIRNENNHIHRDNFIEKHKDFGKELYYWWFRHHKIAEFIRYFMVGNIVTIIQFIILPILQIIFKNTGLINIDFRFLGPIGSANAMTTLDNGVKVFDPYYVFNFTAGSIGTSVERTLNGISGSYLSRGGLAYFLAMFITLVIAQVLTFIMQRKVVFKSSGNTANAVFWFVIATIIITIGQNALYGLYQPWLYGTFGDAIGGLVASFVQALISFWVFYPIFKVIFKKQD